MADLLRRGASARESHVLQEGDDVVAETLVVLVQVVVALGQGLSFLVGEIFSVVRLLFCDIAGGYEKLDVRCMCQSKSYL